MAEYGPEKNRLFRNNTDGTFTRILSGSIANDQGSSTSGVWGDYDRDGFLDLFVANGVGGNGGGDSADYLYRNNGNKNGWLTVKLIGTVSNRSAIGAKVRVKATINGKSFWQLREINTGGGWVQNAFEAHFGLGDATHVETLRIEWPSGIMQTMTNLPSRQFLTIVEHQDANAVAIEITRIDLSSKGAVDVIARSSATSPWPLQSGLRFVFEVSSDLTNWTRLGVRTNWGGYFQIHDNAAAGNRMRFYRVSAP